MLGKVKAFQLIAAKSRPQKFKEMVARADTGQSK
jgi:hypothetical protein